MIIHKTVFIDIKGSTTWDVLSQYNQVVLHPFKNESKWAYRFRYIMHLLHINRFSAYSKINTEIITLRPDSIIIMGSLIYEPYIRNLRNEFPNISINYIYPNIVNCTSSLSPEILRKYNIKTYTWDLGDCRMYSIKYLKPFFNAYILPSSDNNKYDVCFIGKDKGRYKIITEIQDILDKNEISYYIRISPDYSFLHFLKQRYQQVIPYAEYLKVVSQSRGILDIVQKGQIGTTTRVFEAVLSNKKLISNNRDLVNYDFYNPDNIFIIGIDDFSDLKQFLNRPTKPVHPSVVNEYGVERWISDILQNND